MMVGWCDGAMGSVVGFESTVLVQADNVVLGARACVQAGVMGVGRRKAVRGIAGFAEDLEHFDRWGGYRVRGRQAVRKL